MCGRYASNTPPELMRQAFHTQNALPNLPPRYNIAPTQDIAAVRSNPDGQLRSLDLLRWGLIPSWAKDPAIGARLINARAESVADKPAFRDAFRRRRCLIPADAFYEWKAGSRPRQPYAIRRRDGGMMAFAGLWENWKSPAGIWQRSCTIVTTRANALVAPLHDRMPVILDAVDHTLWLGEEAASPDRLQALLEPCPPDLLEAFPVGPAVNDVKNDHSGLLQPLASLPQE